MSSLPESKVPALLPPPFAWCEIPGGTVTIIDSTDETEPVYRKQSHVKRFAMAKYPITHAQFARFIEAGGYQNKEWWTAGGWKLRTEGLRWIKGRPEKTGWAWTEPLFWQENRWKHAEYPVVGVSWYEAFAFCKWLSEASGEPVSLPTEPQWQRAAEGDEKRVYPWGNEWDADRCNNSLSEQLPGQVTPVRQYEGKGDSPFGVVDLAGNVREWCLTTSSGIRGSNAASGAHDRITRGGYWNERVTSRDPYGPTRFYRNDCQNGATASYGGEQNGFRIVLNF